VLSSRQHRSSSPIPLERTYQVLFIGSRCGGTFTYRLRIFSFDGSSSSTARYTLLVAKSF